MLQTLLKRDESFTRISVQRARLGFVNGIHWLVRDPKSVVGRTPFDVILQAGKLTVRRYLSPIDLVQPRMVTPILLIPPLMVKPFIFDLFPGRSLVRYLQGSGFPVYLVDFGEPDRADAYITLDNYVMDWIPSACKAVCQDCQTSHLSLVGYCMGGLFGLVHVAANQDESVKNVVTIGAPLDTHKMGLLAWLTKIGGAQVERMASHVGNVPGNLSSLAFQLLAPIKTVTRYGDLFMNMWNEEYVQGFDAMNQWTRQFIDYPQAAFLQFMRDFMRKNQLIRGKMQFRGKTADLKCMQASLLAFAGETDQIAPPSSVRVAIQSVGSRDKMFLAVPGGHMGVLNGSAAPEHVWKPLAQWLKDRSVPAKAGRDIPARKSTKSTKANQRKKKTDWVH